MSTVSFSVCIHLATFKLFLESTYWNLLNLSTGMLSLIMYYTMLMMAATESIGQAF